MSKVHNKVKSIKYVAIVNTGISLFHTNYGSKNPDHDFYAATEIPMKVQVVNDSWVSHPVQLITLLVMLGRKFWDVPSWTCALKSLEVTQSSPAKVTRNLMWKPSAPNSSWVVCVVTWPQTTRLIWPSSEDHLHLCYLPRSFKHVLNVRFLRCCEIALSPIVHPVAHLFFVQVHLFIH